MYLEDFLITTTETLSMPKVTSLEISKKLSKLPKALDLLTGGCFWLPSDPDFVWRREQESTDEEDYELFHVSEITKANKCDSIIPAYSLQDILNALPKRLEVVYDLSAAPELHISFANGVSRTKNSIGYRYQYGDYSNEVWMNFEVEGLSLEDASAELFILLQSKDYIIVGEILDQA